MNAEMKAEISETIRALPYERCDLGNYKALATEIWRADSLLRFGVQIPKLLTQCKFVSAMCTHAHSNAHKPLKSVAPTI